MHLKKKTRKILFAILAVLLIISMLLPTLAAFAAEPLPENYLVEHTEVVNQYHTDKINNVGHELEKQGVKLIVVAYKEAQTENIKDSIKARYFNWYGQIKNKDLVVVYYYVNDNQFYVYQDSHKYITNRFLKSLEKDMKLYLKNNDPEAGMYYTYSSLADSIAKDLGVRLKSSNSEMKYKESTWIKIAPYVLIGIILGVLSVSFRRKKEPATAEDIAALYNLSSSEENEKEDSDASDTK